MSGRLWFSKTGGMPIGKTPDGSPVFADADGVEAGTELTNFITDVAFGDDDNPTEKENHHVRNDTHE